MARSKAHFALSSTGLACVMATLVACEGAPQKTSCEALQEALGPELAGIRFKVQQECAETLRYLLGPVQDRGLTPAEWFTQVRSQPVRVYLALIEKLAIAGDIGSFDDYPAAIPCGDGIEISEEEWAASPLSVLRMERPERLYYSFQLNTSVLEDGRVHAKLTARSDIDCDDVYGVTLFEGIATPGRNPFKGGWEAIGITGTDNWVE